MSLLGYGIMGALSALFVMWVVVCVNAYLEDQRNNVWQYPRRP